MAEEKEKGGLKGLVGKKMSKEVNFMGEKVKITKLQVSQVIEIQALSKKAQSSEDDGFEVLTAVIKAGVEGAGELTDEEFRNFPLDELSKLSGEVMKYSGIGGDSGK